MQNSAKASNRWVVFGLVATAVFMSTLDGSIVNVALPAVMLDLQAPLPVIEWILVVYLLTVSALMMSFGRLSDIRGRRWVYCRGFVLFVVGSLLCAVARSALWLIAARGFQAVGAAMLMACSPALVVDIFPFAERGKALGMVGTVVAAGLTTGPAIGGLLLGLFSWRVIFYINIPIGLLAAVLAARILKGGPADTPRPEPFDWYGALWFSLCLGAGILALTHANAWGYTSGRIVSLAAMSVAGGVLFYRVETRSAHPLLAPSLLKIRIFTLPVLAAAMLFAGLYAMIFLMPFYLAHPAGFAMDKVGYTMVIPFVFLSFVSPVSGAISDRIGSRLLCTAGMAVLASGLFLLSRLTPDAAFGDIAWRLGLAGIGTATFVSPNNSAVMSAVPPRYRGTAAATTATARTIGMAVGVALAGLTFNGVFTSLSGGLVLTDFKPALAPVFMQAFQWAMLTGAGAAALGVVVALLRGPETGRDRQR